MDEASQFSTQPAHPNGVWLKAAMPMPEPKRMLVPRNDPIAPSAPVNENPGYGETGCP
jgi:hypothetical protein